MAQPQHARDEAHCDNYWLCGVLGGPFGLYHPSAYELYMLACTIREANNGLIGTCPPLSGNYPAVFDQSNRSTYGRFNIPRDFWTKSPAGNGGTPSYGIAEYTNSGFVGARTNFRGTPQAILPADDTNLPLPDGEGAVPNPQSITSIAMLGPLFPITATMTFISTPVNDLYTNTTTVNPMTSAYSIFTSDLWPIHFDAVFSLNELTYSSAAAMLVPRAIGYSAGLLNYFFRGQLGINLPHEGVYGIIDQADQYSANSTTDVSGNTQGFHIIKVALTNASPDGEAMTNGTLAAVLRYRRNNNYVDTLTGEAGASGSGNLAGARGPADEYVVSATVKDPAGNVVSPGQVQLTSSPQEFEFDFPNALPLNSTDVYLQVAWKGELGQPGQPDSNQEQGAVVSSTVDLSEPTYINIFNSLDYISIAGQYVTRDQLNGDQELLNLVQPQSCVDRQTSPATLFARCFSNTQSIPIYLDALNISPDSNSLISLQQLPVDTYARVAVLTNAFGPNANVTLNNASTCDIGGQAFTVNALDNEMAITSPVSATMQSTIQEDADVSVLNSFRGILGWLNIFCVWNGDGATQSQDDPSKIGALSGNDIYPFPVNIKFPQGPPP